MVDLKNISAQTVGSLLIKAESLSLELKFVTFNYYPEFKLRFFRKSTTRWIPIYETKLRERIEIPVFRLNSGNND